MEWYLLELWHSEWDEYHHNKLRKVIPELKDCISCPCNNRRDCYFSNTRWSLVCNRLIFMEGRGELPSCIPCAGLLTVECIGPFCSDFIETREWNFTALSLQVWSHDTSLDSILNFLEEIRIFGRLYIFDHVLVPFCVLSTFDLLAFYIFLGFIVSSCVSPRYNCPGEKASLLTCLPCPCTTLHLHTISTGV